MSSLRSSKNRYSAFLIALAATALFMSTAHAAGSLVISEIMYDAPGTNSGHQWIEITNTGSEATDLSARDLRFFDKTGSHVIAPYGNTSGTLGPGESAVIADKPAIFLADHQGFSGSLFDSVVSLTAGETIGFKTTDGTVLTSIVYSSADGAKGDGNSLHSSGNSLTAGSPNPGLPGTPAPISKPSVTSASTSRSTASAPVDTNPSSHSPPYDKGISAPATEAYPSAAGAAVVSSGAVPFLQYLFSSIWFAVFLGLLVFSGASLILIRKHA